MICQQNKRWYSETAELPTAPLRPATQDAFPVSAMVYIDAIREGEIHGSFQNVSDCFTCEFQGLTQFLFELDAALDDMQTPQDFMRRRTWEKETRRNQKSGDPQRQGTVSQHQKRGLPDAMLSNARRGIVATFCIQVITRRHASWQGTIRWLEENKVQCFRSVLELLGLVYEASGQDIAARENIN